MKQQSRRRSSLVSFANCHGSSAWLIAAALLGCAREQVSLGSGQEVAKSDPLSACGDGVFEGDLTGSDQQRLDSLQGCTEVTGDLQLPGFAGMDLSPLSELRIVRGELHVGSSNPSDWTADGMPSSLAGLEGLEQVNGLTLEHVMATDLSGLAGLQRVARDPLGPHAEGGKVRITNCDLLLDLSGLDSLVSFDALEIAGNAQLESLNGLRVPPTLRSVFLGGGPALKDVSALASLRDVQHLVLQETAIETLDGLQLENAEIVNLTLNDDLTDVESLSSLVSLRTLIVRSNARLRELPELDDVDDISAVSVVDNAELRSVPSIRGGQRSGLLVSALESGEVLVNNGIGFDFFEVGGNPKLTRIAGIGSLPEGRVIVIYENASLTEIDLGPLSALQGLHIVGNAGLTSVQLPQLQRVMELQVRDNPLLSTSAFAGVQSLSGQLSGNLD